MRAWFVTFLLLSLGCSVWLLNSCAGAARNRADILSSLSEDIDTAPEQAAEQAIEQAEKSNIQKKDDQQDFNYFPYDLQLDTMAYLSCASNQWFHFKAGAYFSRSGLRLSEYFLKQATKLKNENKLKELVNSSTKKAAIPQFRLGSTQLLTAVISGFKIPLPILSKEIPDLVKRPNTRRRIINDEPIEFIWTNNAMQSILPRVSNLNVGRMVLLYLNNRDNNNVIANTDQENFVRSQDIYGRVYKLSFEEEKNQRFVLEGIEEKQYPQKTTPDEEWVCPEVLKLAVRRHEDNINTAAGEPSCPPSKEGNALPVLTKIISTKNWNINLEEKCISPIKSSHICYDQLAKQTTPTKFMRVHETDDTCNNTNTNHGGWHRCPHYLSICIRKN